MKGIRSLFALILIITLFSYCDNVLQRLSIGNTKKVIVIQPFADFPKSDLDEVVTHFLKIYEEVEVNDPIQLPKSALNFNKTRYRADSIIHFLGRHTEKGKITIGLTTKDISTTKGKHQDWGVFGLGFRPGNACVASNYRLKGSNKREKYFKVVLHELGHCQGLKHCEKTDCYMRDAEGKDHLNELTQFCEKCKIVLTRNGWKVE